jgi:hypothetical protein
MPYLLDLLAEDPTSKTLSSLQQWALKGVQSSRNADRHTLMSKSFRIYKKNFNGRTTNEAPGLLFQTARASY